MQPSPIREMIAPCEPNLTLSIFKTPAVGLFQCYLAGSRETKMKRVFLHIAPGDPTKAVNAGTIVLAPDVFKSVVANVATSLKSQGFKNIYTMVDHGSAAGPMTEVSKRSA